MRPVAIDGHVRQNRLSVHLAIPQIDAALLSEARPWPPTEFPSGK